MLTNNSYLSEAYEALERNKNKSTKLIFERLSINNSDRYILDEEQCESSHPFKKMSDEKIILKIDNVVWVENLSLGELILTDKRIFYTPQKYDISMTTKYLNIPLNKITIFGHWVVQGSAGIISFIGDSNANVEFVTPKPLNVLKFWKAIKGLKYDWSYLKQQRIDKLQKSGMLKGLSLANGTIQSNKLMAKGATMMSKFLGAK
jgi:hypothetical protein